MGPERAAGLVRAKGLEPPHLSILEPKSSASTSSATPAGPPVARPYNRDGARGKAGTIRRAGALGAEAREDEMDYRQLGSSDLRVSEISLGSWLTYGVGVERDKARACLEEAFEQGINFIDTANIYGRGAAESFLGAALQRRP